MVNIPRVNGNTDRNCDHISQCYARTAQHCIATLLSVCLSVCLSSQYQEYSDGVHHQIVMKIAAIYT